MSRFIKTIDEEIVERHLALFKETDRMAPPPSDDQMRNEIRASLDLDDGNQCLHFKGGRKCDASDWIPDEISFDDFDHRNPFPGDNGIRFLRASINI